MIIRLLGFMDLFAGITLFLMKFQIVESLGLILGLFILAKALVFISDVVSVMDLLAAFALILASQGHYYFLTWIFVLWLMQKGFFSFFS